jgi:hypothetical protein
MGLVPRPPAPPAHVPARPHAAAPRLRALMLQPPARRAARGARRPTLLPPSARLPSPCSGPPPMGAPAAPPGPPPAPHTQSLSEKPALSRKRTDAGCGSRRGHFSRMVRSRSPPPLPHLQRGGSWPRGVTSFQRSELVRLGYGHCRRSRPPPPPPSHTRAGWKHHGCARPGAGALPGERDRRPPRSGAAYTPRSAGAPNRRQRFPPLARPPLPLECAAVIAGSRARRLVRVGVGAAAPRPARQVRRADPKARGHGPWGAGAWAMGRGGSRSRSARRRRRRRRWRGSGAGAARGRAPLRLRGRAGTEAGCGNAAGGAARGAAAGPRGFTEGAVQRRRGPPRGGGGRATGGRGRERGVKRTGGQQGGGRGQARGLSGALGLLGHSRRWGGPLALGGRGTHAAGCGGSWCVFRGAPWHAVRLRAAVPGRRAGWT